MADTYKKLSELPLTQSPSLNATAIIVDGGNDYRVPLAKLVPIDRAISSKDDLPATAAVDDVKWFINTARDWMECWEFREDNKWHQVL